MPRDRERQRVAQHQSYLRNKDQIRARKRSRKQSTQDWLWEIKCSLKCETCGENDPACLDFHHTNPATKSFQVTDGAKFHYGKETILQEIAKCECLCANCHRKLHCKRTRPSAKQ